MLLNLLARSLERHSRWNELVHRVFGRANDFVLKKRSQKSSAKRRGSTVAASSPSMGGLSCRSASRRWRLSRCSSSSRPGTTLAVSVGLRAAAIHQLVFEPDEFADGGRGAVHAAGGDSVLLHPANVPQGNRQHRPERLTSGEGQRGQNYKAARQGELPQALTGREINDAAYLRWRILDRMRRFLRPSLRRPFPVFFVPTHDSVEFASTAPRRATAKVAAEPTPPPPAG